MWLTVKLIDVMLMVENWRGSELVSVFWQLECACIIYTGTIKNYDWLELTHNTRGSAHR